MDLQHLIPELDAVIALTRKEYEEREAREPGLGRYFPSFIKSLENMKERILDDSLTQEERRKLYGGLGRTLDEVWDFNNSPLGRRIDNVARQFGGFPPISDDGFENQIKTFLHCIIKKVRRN